MISQDIIRLLVRDRWVKSFCLPNYAPANWWECDMIEITKAGYVREYEVKISRADFFADAGKTNEVRDSGRHELIDPSIAKFPGQSRWVCDVEKKHDLLAAGSVRGPSRFHYVAPEGLLRPEEIPVWAGLIEIKTDERYPGRLFEHEIIKAPRLHSEKVGEAVRQHALGVCYYRLHRLLKKTA